MSNATTGPNGEVAHRDLIAHSAKFERRFYRVTDDVYVAVGYGMSNTSVVFAPDGLVVVDTGESVEEAREHVAEARKISDAPARALIYSHCHYIDGSQAWIDEAGAEPLEVWGHERLPEIRANIGAEIGPAYRRRLTTQFGIHLPQEGPDAMPNQGLGPFFSNPHHPRPTRASLPLTHTISGEQTETIAGQRFEFIPAPADSDDSIIISLPDRGVVINNNVWPALFNIYPLRGEQYRDPLGLVDAVDRIRDLDPEHLVGVHGPPISGRDEVREGLRNYRDAIQYLWDQTVRGINRGLGPEELAHEIALPPHLADAPLNRQFYGLVPHHVRQIHNGLFGWYGNDPADLFRPEPADEARRMIEGFGGRARVLEQARGALDADDAPWAVRLAGWLVRVDPDDGEARGLRAEALRRIAQETTSANTRSVCLTAALELEGKADTLRISRRPAAAREVLSAPPTRFVEALRVQLDPAKAADVERTLVWRFTDSGAEATLEVRRGVAAFVARDTGGAGDLGLALSHKTWARLWAGEQTLADAVERGDVSLTGALDDVLAFFDLFDLVKLKGR